MIVTIDGPAGAGKSFAARSLAQRLSFRFLDTGAMYRAVALAAIRRDVNLEDEQALSQLARQITIELCEDQVLVDGHDVTDEIRTRAVTRATRYVADNKSVRQHLVQLQQTMAAGIDTVTEGRDQGTVAFPHAECKIYLTASPEERARRRMRDLEQRGEQINYQQVLAEQTERDQRDLSRPVGRLMRAKDAVEICTDGMTPEQVVERLVQLAHEKLSPHVD